MARASEGEGARGSRGGGLIDPVAVGFVARATLVVLGISALAALLWLGREVVFVAFFGALFALFLSIFVNPLVRWGVPRLLAVLFVILALLSVAAFLGWLIWPTLREQVNLVRVELPGALEDVATWVQARYREITGEVDVGVSEAGLTDGVQAGTREVVGRIMAGALPLLQTATGIFVGVFLVFVTGIYLVVEPRTYVRGLTSLVPAEGRERFQGALYSVGRDLRRWILGTAIDMLIIGVLTTIGLALLGVPAPLALGLIAAILEFIPFYGPILSAVPAVAVALLASPELALWVIVLYTGIQQAEAHLIHPLVMRETVRLPPALTVLVGAFMAILFGFLGLVLAVPLLATALVLTRRLYVKPLNAHALRIAEAPPGTPEGVDE